MALVLCGLLIIGTAACAGAGADSETASATATMDTYAADEGGYTAYADGESASTALAAGNATAVVDDEALASADGRKIIRTASLTVETKAYDEAVGLLREAVSGTEGYIEYTSSYSGGGTRSAEYRCRIPVDRYAEFFEKIEGVGSVVRTEEGADDATNQYVDIEARLNSLRTQETRLLALMEESGSLQELLAVQEKLMEVQYEIESYTGQMKALENSIDYATITVYLEEVRTYTPVEPTFGDRAAQAFTNMLNGIVDGAQGFVILLIYALPVLVIGAVAAVVIVVCVRRSKRRRRPPYPPVPPQENRRQ